MPYHLRIEPKKDSLFNTEYKFDLKKEILLESYLKSYYEGKPIVINGRTINLEDIKRININLTEETSKDLIPLIEKEHENDSTIMPDSNKYYITKEGKNVTDDFIKDPPGKKPNANNKNEIKKVENPRKVFVVHGRNLQARDALFSFLRSIDIRPIEWTEAVKFTGKGSPYIGEILDVAFSQAQAVLVLMTPDDEARLREIYRKSDDPTHETQLTPQARPNVLFEAGMAISRDENRTILIELGKIRPFSDIGGRHVIKLDNSTQKRQDLAQRLENAGCLVNLSGTDWHTVGDFDNIIKNDSYEENTVDTLTERSIYGKREEKQKETEEKIKNYIDENINGLTKEFKEMTDDYFTNISFDIKIEPNDFLILKDTIINKFNIELSNFYYESKKGLKIVHISGLSIGKAETIKQFLDESEYDHKRFTYE